MLQQKEAWAWGLVFAILICIIFPQRECPLDTSFPHSPQRCLQGSARDWSSIPSRTLLLGHAFSLSGFPSLLQMMCGRNDPPIQSWESGRGLHLLSKTTWVNKFGCGKRILRVWKEEDIYGNQMSLYNNAGGIWMLLGKMSSEEMRRGRMVSWLQDRKPEGWYWHMGSPLILWQVSERDFTIRMSS